MICEQNLKLLKVSDNQMCMRDKENCLYSFQAKAERVKDEAEMLMTIITEYTQKTSVIVCNNDLGNISAGCVHFSLNT